MRRHPGGADRRGDDGYRSCRPLPPPPRPDRQELKASKLVRKQLPVVAFDVAGLEAWLHQGSSPCAGGLRTSALQRTMTVFESGLPGLSATPTTSSFYIDGRGFRATKGNGVKHHFSALLTAS